MVIIEASGEYKTGKTQLTHNLWVNAQLSIGNRGDHRKVNFIDTENTFSAELIKEISK